MSMCPSLDSRPFPQSHFAKERSNVNPSVSYVSSLRAWPEKTPANIVAENPKAPLYARLTQEQFAARASYTASTLVAAPSPKLKRQSDAYPIRQLFLRLRLGCIDGRPIPAKSQESRPKRQK